jgi:deoxyribodipyrimidine photo-lyase
MIQWFENDAAVECWRTGNTGFPIVDAAMRCLVQTGYIPNRARLIVANFFHRMIGANWKLGEHFFATHLIDYDPCICNGSWQWI